MSGELGINDVEDFAVATHYNDPEADREVQVARIDTSHGYVHFDKLFREEQPKTLLDIDAYWEAEELLRDDWRRYAKRYETNHSVDE